MILSRPGAISLAHDAAVRTSTAYLTSPNMFNLCEGFRLDQIYTSEKASEADKNGRVKSGDMICDDTRLSSAELSPLISG